MRSRRNRTMPRSRPTRNRVCRPWRHGLRLSARRQVTDNRQYRYPRSREPTKRHRFCGESEHRAVQASSCRATTNRKMSPRRFVAGPRSDEAGHRRPVAHRYPCCVRLEAWSGMQSPHGGSTICWAISTIFGFQRPDVPCRPTPHSNRLPVGRVLRHWPRLRDAQEEPAPGWCAIMPNFLDDLVDSVFPMLAQRRRYRSGSPCFAMLFGPAAPGDAGERSGPILTSSTFSAPERHSVAVIACDRPLDTRTAQDIAMKDHYSSCFTTWPQARARVPVHGRLHPQPRSQSGPRRAHPRHRAEQMIFETMRRVAQFFGFRRLDFVVSSPNADSLNTRCSASRRGRPRSSPPASAQSVLRPLYHLPRDHVVRGPESEARARDVDADAIRDARPRAPAWWVNAWLERARIGPGSRRDRGGRREAGAVFVVDTAQSAGRDPHRHGRARQSTCCASPATRACSGRWASEGWSSPAASRSGTSGSEAPGSTRSRVPARRLSAPPGGGHRLHTRHRGAERRAEVVRGPGPRAAWAAAPDADHATACGYALLSHRVRGVSHVRHIQHALDAMEGVTVYGPRGNRPRVATLSFNIDSLPATQVGEMLDADYHVCVRAGLHCAPLVHEDQGTARDSGSGADRPRVHHRRRGSGASLSGRSRSSRGSRGGA